ncbi:MAG TPA: FAD-binding oxidoreductase [Jatrophihabitans sp.]|nr:FAD-binding oxidoreductase [Jatrophihabitans sp.]
MRFPTTAAPRDADGVPPAPPATALRGLCGGAVHLPGDPGYDMARSPWNLQIQHHPAAVAYPASPEEVAEVLLAARHAGLRVVPQGTGHGAAPLDGHLGDAVILRTAGLRELHIDPRRRRARAGAGVLWGDLVDAAGHHGLAGLHPSSPDVGVVGFSISGGIGWYARQYGLQCSAITAVEVVLADGSIVRATADNEPELLWALRGSSMPLGVVTALEFDLIPLDSVVAGYLAWDWAQVETVLPAWAEWATHAPDAATTSFRLLKAPPLPHIPAELQGRGLVLVDGAILGSDETAAEIIAPLRALRPEFDTVTRVPAPTVVRLHLEPEGPTPAYASSRLLTGLPDDAIAAVIDSVGPNSGTRLDIAEFRQLGGALLRPDPGSALSSLDGQFLVLGLALGDDPAEWNRLRGDAGRLLHALEPWTTGRQYLPMLDDNTDTRKAFPPDVHARLSALRAALDPERLFVGQHMTAVQAGRSE